MYDILGIQTKRNKKKKTNRIYMYILVYHHYGNDFIYILNMPVAMKKHS